MHPRSPVYSVNYAGVDARSFFKKHEKRTQKQRGRVYGGDKRRFGGQARALWKLFSYPFSVNLLAHSRSRVQ